MTSSSTISLIGLALLLLIPLVYYVCRPPSIPSVPNATPHYPLIGNSVAYGINPTEFLLDQQRRHGNIFLVDLVAIRIVFFLGPEGTNAILKGTDKSGISFWAAMEFVIGEAIKKGREAEGWIERSTRPMQRILASSQHFDAWTKLAKPIAKDRFTEWADSGEPIPIFREMSYLVMTLVVNIIMGPDFTEKHGHEVVPMIQAYEWALQKPQTKVLPRWLSREGRILDSVEGRMIQLIGEEIRFRLSNPEKCQMNLDYMQSLLNEMGGECVEGTSPITPMPILAFALHLLVLCIAGHTNQSTTTVWTILHALRSPLMEQLRHSKSRDVLDGTFRESGRLYTNLMLLRRITVSQEILGKQMPKGTFVACSPVVTARDPRVYPEPEKFRPERWLTETSELDEAKIKSLHRIGASGQFGKGQHACIGERLARFMVMDLLWGVILGEDHGGGFDIEIVSGITEGLGLDNVGVEAAWAEENLGTPSEKGGPVMLRFSKRKV